MGCYIGLDFGTSSIKATAIDDSGQTLIRARVPCETVSPESGWFEVEAETMWRGGLERALARLGSALVRSARAVCVSSVCASFVPVDENLSPLYNAILYGIDTRAREQVERLNATLPPAVISKIAGAGFTSHSVLPKLLWLKERLPDLYRRTRYFLESSNFVTSYLTGEAAWDGPSAAGGHMVDLERIEYPLDLLRDMGLDSKKLPRLANSLDVLGTVGAAAAARTELPEGIPVLVGACDVNAEAFASAAVDPGELTFVYGSTVSTLFILDAFKSLSGFLTGPSLLAGTYRAGGATSSGGRYLDWVRDFAGLRERPAITSTSTPSRLLMVPYLDGARTPNQEPKARVAWYGMDSFTTGEDLWKAAMESIGYELALVLRRLSEAAPLPRFIHAMGGLSSNQDFLQIVSNITGVPHLRFPDVDASYGDALMALSAERGMDAVRAIWKERGKNRAGDREGVDLVAPEAGAHERYSELMSKYIPLNDTVLRLA